MRVMFLTLLDLQTAVDGYTSTCEKTKGTKSHVYLELYAKRAPVRAYTNKLHARKEKLTEVYF